jgi:hypothetical protein
MVNYIMNPCPRRVNQSPLFKKDCNLGTTLSCLVAGPGTAGLLTRSFAFLLLLFALGVTAQAQSVTLAWDAVTDDNLAGYRVYQGLASGSYALAPNLGNVTQTTLSGLTPGLTYYFACTAYNSNNLESDFSSEVIYTVTNPAPVLTLTSPADGASFTLPTTINLAASVTPNGHTITKVQFLMDGTLVNEATTSPYTFALANATVGVHSLSASASYDSGSTAASQNTPLVTVLAAKSPSGLTFAADSGTINAPFALLGGVLSQSLLTGLLGSGRAAYDFTISTPGDYIVSALVNAPNNGADSFYVNIDSEPTDPFMIWDIPATTGFTNRTVTWEGLAGSSPTIFKLSAGTHQLIIRGREANTQLQTITISPAYPQLQISSQPGQLILLSGLGLAGHTYEIQASQDLQSWTVIGTATPDPNGSVSFLDSDAPSFSSRSYRLRDTAP